MGCSSPQSPKSLYCPQHAQRRHLAPSRKRIWHLIGRKDSCTTPLPTWMIDNIADGEGLVHGVGAGEAAVMFMVRCQFCSMSSAAFCALAAAVEGVEVGLKEFTASLRVSPAFTRQTAVFPFASLGVAGG